ncbi:MAG: recombinase RecT [Planctomycetia bacterium]|nr:recombinase RecT [Planctomycetia bacterium]
MSTTTLAPSTNGQAPEQLTSSPTKSLLSRLGERFGVDAEKMLGTLKQTAFRQRADKSGQIKDVTTEQMMALLIVADQYHLNPWTREIYAFPQDGGIVPIVGVDGWIRMMNEHPQFDGVQFVDGPEVGDKPNLVNEWIECQIFRKDRSHPIVVREYIVECRKDTGPWRSHPRRMLRHKALIQACRIAFGFAGIHDEDEGLTVTDGIATVKKAEPQWPTGRVNHRLTHSVKTTPPDVVDATATVSEELEEETAFDQEKEIRRQELISWLNDQLNSDVSDSVLDEVAAKLRDSHTMLGADIIHDMQQRLNAKRAGGVAPKVKRNF